MLRYREKLLFVSQLIDETWQRQDTPRPIARFSIVGELEHEGDRNCTTVNPEMTSSIESKDVLWDEG